MFAPDDIVVGANAERSRNHNRQMVLGRVRSAGQIGRAEIARASGLSTQAVSNIIADLLADQMIVETGRRAGTRGLPAVQYSLNPSGGFALGVEIRPDVVFASLLNLSGETVAVERQEMHGSESGSIFEVLRHLRETVLETSAAPGDRLMGAGVVMPGPFGTTGIRGNESELRMWDGVPPAESLSDALGLPVFLENDANAAAMAERVSGVAQSFGTYAFLYFGSGLGLGVVDKGRLMKGGFGNAGEIGHIPVPSANGTVTLESVVSRLSVQRHMQSAGIHIRTSDELARLYELQHPALMTWLDAAMTPLSAAVTIIENLLDPETIVLGGAMPDNILDHLVGGIRLSERSVSHRVNRSAPRLLRGASGRMTATLGAAALVINQAFTPSIAATQ